MNDPQIELFQAMKFVDCSFKIVDYENEILYNSGFCYDIPGSCI